MLLQCIVGVILAIIGMFVAFGMVRWAANVLILVLCGGACTFVVYQIFHEQWTGWPDICVYALLSGGVAAILSLPALPFSSLQKRK